MFPAHAGMDRTRSTRSPARRPCSPHTRGWTGAHLLRGRTSRVFPAHAGMDRKRRHPLSIWVRVPRTRGDGPDCKNSSRSCFWCSPHTRGWTGNVTIPKLTAGVFPAHAGMDRRLSFFERDFGGVVIPPFVTGVRSGKRLSGHRQLLSRRSLRATTVLRNWGTR